MEFSAKRNHGTLPGDGVIVVKRTPW